MKSTIKNRLDELEAQLSSRTGEASLVIINIIDASEGGIGELTPVGYTCNIGGAERYFPGTAEQAVDAALAMMKMEPKVPGAIPARPVLIACLEEPCD